MLDKIILTDIDESAGGSIIAGDHIVKIDNDDISTWTMMRGNAKHRVEFVSSFYLL
jgi:hypothetical protein